MNTTRLIGKNRGKARLWIEGKILGAMSLHLMTGGKSVATHFQELHWPWLISGENLSEANSQKGKQ